MFVLEDYSTGLFPPAFADQQAAYQKEMEFLCALPGTSKEEVALAELRKPFRFGKCLQTYTAGFLKVISVGKRPHPFFRPHWLLAQR